jgi:hypothetical protein
MPQRDQRDGCGGAEAGGGADVDMARVCVACV